MALAKCPKCGMTVSTDMKSCPNCGYSPYSKNTSLQRSTSSYPAYRPASTTHVVPDDDNEDEEDEVTGHGKLIKIFTVSVVIIAVMLVGLFARNIILKKNAEKARDNYILQMHTIRMQMLLTASEAESAGRLVHDVWYNTIHKEYNSRTDKYTQEPHPSNPRYTRFCEDFNDSLRALFADPDFGRKIDSIEEGYDEVEKIYRDLQNPPADMTAAYAIFDDLYDSFQSLVKCATDPSGSLISYTQEFNKADGDFIKYYEKLGAVLPELPKDSTSS